METGKLKAIFFDVGDTLNRPTSGHWFIPVSHQELFAREFDGLKAPFVQNALQKAMAFSECNHRMDTEKQEFDHFREFYRILLTECRYPQITEELLSDFAYDIVYNNHKFIYFEDVFTVIPELEKRYLLGIISNTWPSLERKLRSLKLRGYFKVFVKSCDFGTWKPDPRLYMHALQQGRISAEEAIFIDDSIENLEGAAKLGMQGVLINRYQKEIADCRFPVINNLFELNALLPNYPIT